MGAAVLNRARVRKGSIVAAGSVVREGQVIGPGHLAAGAPAVFKKNIADISQDRLKGPVNNYLMLSRHHRSG